MSIEDAFSKLQTMAVEAQETLFIMNALRKKVLLQQTRNKKEKTRIKKEKMKKGEKYEEKDYERFEVDLVKLGVIQQVILILKSCENIMDKVKMISCKMLRNHVIELIIIVHIVASGSRFGINQFHCFGYESKRCIIRYC